jgi:hypothetical protein
VDVRASTQRVYVPGHNITNCQGLEDFGRFLVITGIDTQKGERYLREAFIPRIAPVSPHMIMNFIAEKVLGLPKSY